MRVSACVFVVFVLAGLFVPVAQAAIVPSGASLLQVTQNVNLDVAVTPQTGGGVETEFNAQMPFTKPSLGSTAGYYSSLTYEPFFNNMFTWYNTTVFADLPRRTSEYSPQLPSSTVLYFRYNNVTLNYYVFEVFSSKLPTAFSLFINDSFYVMTATGNTTHMEISRLNNVINTYALLQRNMTSDTHYIAFTYLQGIVTFTVDQDVFTATLPALFNTTFSANMPDEYSSSTAATRLSGTPGLDLYISLPTNTVLFALDSNVMIPRGGNYVTFNTTETTTITIPEWHAKRCLGTRTISDRRYYLEYSQNAQVVYSRARLAAPESTEVWSPVVYPNLNVQNGFFYSFDKYHLNSYNHFAMFAFMLDGDAGAATQIAWINYTSASGALTGTMARIYVNATEGKVFVELYRHPLETNTAVIIGPIGNFATWESGTPIYLFLNAYGESDGINAYLDAGVYVRGTYFWRQGIVEGATIGGYNVSVYNIGFAGARLSSGFEYPASYLPLPNPLGVQLMPPSPPTWVPGYRALTIGGTLIAAYYTNTNSTPVYGASPTSAFLPYLAATFGAIRSVAQTGQTPAIPSAAQPQFTLAGGNRYDFSPENIDLRRVTMSLNYSSSIPQNLSVLSDVRLSAEITFFGGRQLEHVWFGNEQGLLYYDTGEIAIAQVQNGQTATGVQVVLYVEQLAYVDLTDPAIYNQAVTRGIGAVVISYNIYATYIPNTYTAGWMFNIALTMLAPLAILVMFPVVIHKVWKRRFAYGAGLMVSGTVLLTSALTSTIVAGFTIMVGMLITIILFKTERDT